MGGAGPIRLAALVVALAATLTSILALPTHAWGLGSPIRLAEGHNVDNVRVDAGLVYSMEGSQSVLQSDPISGSTTKIYTYPGNGFLGAYGVGGGRFAVGYATIVSHRKGLRTRVEVADSPGAPMRMLASGTSGWGPNSSLCGASANLHDVDPSGNVLYSSGRASKSFRRCGKRLRGNASLFVSSSATDPRFPAPVVRVHSSKGNAQFLGGSIDGPWVVASGFLQSDLLINWKTGSKTTLDQQGLFGGIELPGNEAVVAIRQPGKSYSALPASVSVDPASLRSGASLGKAPWDTHYMFCGSNLFAVRSGLSNGAAWIKLLVDPFSGNPIAQYVVGPTSNKILSAACDASWLAFTSGNESFRNSLYGIDLR